MPRIPDNAIVVSVTVSLTYSVVHQMDRHIPGRKKLYHEYIHTERELVGSAQVLEHLPRELQGLGAKVVKKVSDWEYQAKEKVQAESRPAD